MVIKEFYQTSKICQTDCFQRIIETLLDPYILTATIIGVIISFGFESISPTVLKSMQKPITVEQINNAIIADCEHKKAFDTNYGFVTKEGFITIWRCPDCDFTFNKLHEYKRGDI